MKIKKSLREIVLTISFCLLSTFGISQTNDIQIQFIGNCGFHMTDGKTNFYIDFPYKSGAYGYMEFKDSELDSIKENSVFIFTHTCPKYIFDIKK